MCGGTAGQHFPPFLQYKINVTFKNLHVVQKEITITIKKDSIKSTLNNILNKFEIEDLYINEPPVDEIIGDILVKEKV